MYNDTLCLQQVVSVGHVLLTEIGEEMEAFNYIVMLYPLSGYYRKADQVQWRALK